MRFLAGSPLLAAWAQQPGGVIATAKDGLSLMGFEEAAHKVLPPAHWGYMASGVDDDYTQKMNREGFKRFQLRPRRLVDVSKVDLKTEVFGTVWESPIFLCPVGGQRMFHAEGEVAVARAAKARKTVQIFERHLDAGRGRGARPGISPLVSALHAGALGRNRKAGAPGGRSGLPGAGLDG